MPQEEGEVVISRVRFPKKEELFGMIETRLGFGRMNIICADGKTRIGVVPGKYKRRLWLREGDIVIILPWEYEGDKKCNVLFKYRKSHVEFLRNNNYLKALESE
ncbi:MAG: translation initiation factor IF-1A [Candidatus Nanohalarchaeota archaeon]|nr:MAG: translation initiation factor IF-1A [Candidatus Nanohaloarchaeota archaeon]